jgi:hypothetical protein
MVKIINVKAKRARAVVIPFINGSAHFLVEIFFDNGTQWGTYYPEIYANMSLAKEAAEKHIKRHFGRLDEKKRWVLVHKKHRHLLAV